MAKKTGTASRNLKTASDVGQSAGRAVGKSAGSTGRGRSPSTAILAVAAAGGILFWDLGTNRTKLTEQGKLHAALAFGLGAVILIGLADALPELGVPLSVLLLLTVAVGRPAAVEGLAGILRGVSPSATPSPSGGAAVHAGGHAGPAGTVNSPNTVGGAK